MEKSYVEIIDYTYGIDLPLRGFGAGRREKDHSTEGRRAERCVELWNPSRRHSLCLGHGRRERRWQNSGELRGRRKAVSTKHRSCFERVWMSPDDVVSVQVYLTDGALFDRMNTVYKVF